MEMDFRFLIDAQRKLFSIGFQQATHSLDDSFYDLLASEARLASFIAIAKNEAPVEHWFQLGRTLTSAAGERALVSWSGSMFEYLMPLLVMRAFPSTLLAQTYERRDRPPSGARRRAQGPVGRERERVQRPRPARHLPVPGLRRAGPGAQAGPGPGSRRRTLRLGARDAGGPAARARQSRPPGAARRARPVRLSRRAGLHPAGSRSPACRRLHLHGPPPRHGPRRAHQPAVHRHLAAPLSRRRAGPLGRAAAARARAPSAGPSAGPGCPSRRGAARARPGGARGAPARRRRHAGAPRRAAGPSARTPSW